MYLMMNIEISCKGHCESFSHFLYLVSYTDKAMETFTSFLNGSQRFNEKTKCWPKRKFILSYFSMNYRDFSVKSKLIFSLFQTVKLSLSISLFRKIGFS